MRLTIAWITNRKDPKLAWFLDSIYLQKASDDDIRFVLVDFYALEPNRLNELLAETGYNWPPRDKITHAEVYPNVYQGRYRLTKENHFNAAAASNTAICLCQDDYVVFADDLSVVRPGWLNAVKDAVKRGGITCGCYQKVRKLDVQKGAVRSFEEFEGGKDHRLKVINPNGGPQKAFNTWFFGCSFVAPIESLLRIGGFPEALCASLAYQDGAASIMLSNNGEKFMIDPNMLTFESEEHHHLPGQYFVRRDPCKGDPNANPRDDMSHAMLRIVKDLKFHPNHFGPEGIRGLRERALRGEPFPITQIPQHCWYEGKLLSEL